MALGSSSRSFVALETGLHFNVFAGVILDPEAILVDGKPACLSALGTTIPEFLKPTIAILRSTRWKRMTGYASQPGVVASTKEAGGLHL